MKNNKIFLEELSDEGLAGYLSSKNERSFRIKQVKQYLVRGVPTIDDMTSLPKLLRKQMKEEFRFGSVKIEDEYKSSVDDTVKYLFKLYDGNCVEGVLMKYKYGYSVCISSQAGCRMGCKFCASATEKFGRNLTAHEMLRQVYLMQNKVEERIGHVVIMGIGEPFDNYENVLQFLKLVHDEDGFNIGYRKITLSTCGIVTRIYDFAKEEIPVNLSISLHAPTDDLRKKIMPSANKWSIKDILKACKAYIRSTNRRVTFEYALIEGFNTDKKYAYMLARLLKGILCHVNIIPLNDIKDTKYKKPDRDTTKTFFNILKKEGIPVTLRRELGSDINAACGQLRKTNINK